MADKIPSIYHRFPSAEKILSRKFKNLEDMKTTATISIDANVLLAPYKLESGVDSLKSVRSIYEPLAKSGRLFVTGHALREFVANRGVELGNVNKHILEQNSKIHLELIKPYACLAHIAEYAEAIAEIVELRKKTKEIQKNFLTASTAIRSWLYSDPVWDLYRECFSNRVFDLEPNEIPTIVADYKQRIENGQPPGHKDSGKDDNREGDLIIWKTLIKLANETKNDVIFVTNDEKSDWYIQSNKEALYQRHDLSEEFSEKTNGKSLRLISFPDFLRLFGAEDEIVKEAEFSQRSQQVDVFELSNECSALARQINQFLNMREESSPSSTRPNSPDEAWSSYAESVTSYYRVTMNMYTDLFHFRAVHLARKLHSMNVIDDMEYSRIKHPTNPLGVRFVATTLGTSAELIRSA